MKYYHWIYRAILLLSMIGFGACQTYDTQVNVIIESPQGQNCEPFTITGHATCFRSPVDETKLLIQTRTDDSQLTHQNLQMTLTGTVQIITQANTTSISNLQGTILISIQGITQIIPSGGTLQLEHDLDAYQLIDRRIIPLYLDDIAQELLLALPESIDLPDPIAPPDGYIPPATATATTRPLSATELAIGTFTPEPTVCSPRDDWYTLHTVQRGDTLGRIAQQYDTSITALEMGNCLTDINRLQIGQRLLVPGNATVAPANMASPTPSAVFFRADRNILDAGMCTTLRWDVLNIDEVYLDGELTTSPSIREVCPLETTGYTLRVVYLDGRESEHFVEIIVSATPLTPESSATNP